MNKATRLAIAAAIAPVLRDAASKSRARRVKVVSCEALEQPGPLEAKIKKIVTLADVQEGVLALKKIELEVDGVRPKEIVCIVCGTIRNIRKVGLVPKFCHKCTVRQKNRRIWEANLEINRKTSRLAVRKWRVKNLEKALKKERENHRKRRAANPEKVLEQERKWRATNPEKVREMSRKKRARNPEKERDYVRKCREVNREKYNANARKKRAENLEQSRLKAREYYRKKLAVKKAVQS